MLYGIKFLLIALITLPLGVAVLCVGPFDKTGRCAYAVSRLWGWSVLKIGGVRLNARGLDRLDPGRPYVFIANHQSLMDIPVMLQTFPRFQLRWVAKKELLYVPFFGWALWASKHIIVDRADYSKAAKSLRKAKEKIESGVSVVIFPEGTRSASGALLPFKKGGFLLAVKTKTPIVPVTINGSREVLLRKDWRIHGGEVEVVVGDPIPADSFYPADLQGLVTRVRGIIEAALRRPASPPDHGPAAAKALASAES